MSIFGSITIHINAKPGEMRICRDIKRQNDNDCKVSWAYCQIKMFYDRE